jgi:hypothetical protein
MQEDIDSMVGRLRQEATAEEQDAFPFGDLQVTIRHFEKAIVFHFPTGRKKGVIVGLEPEVANEVHSFIVESRRRLFG